MTRLSLNLQGTFQINLNQRELGGLGTNKTRALLVYLVVENKKRIHRDTIATLLWPGQDEKLAKQSLRQALFALNKAFGEEEILVVSSQYIQLNPEIEVWSDTVEIERLAGECHKHNHRSIERCIPCLKCQERIWELYRGEFLAELPIMDSITFNEWYILKRERMHQIALAASIYLGNYYERRGDLARSLSIVEDQLVLEPWREESHAQAMRINALIGERSKALAQYQTCKKVLQEEFGVEPTLETQKLAHFIQQGEPITRRDFFAVPKIPSEFIGRQKEINTLIEMLSIHENRLITILGPGGIGKSTLALALANSLRGLYRDGIVFVPLSDSDDVVSSIAQNLAQEGVFTENALLSLLRDRDLLLILDNFEGHLDESKFIWNLVAQCDGLQVVITSRALLNIRGEHSLHLKGLPYPRVEELEGWKSYDGMLLLDKLIRQINPFFPEDEENLTKLRDIVEKLDGHPLAIEFAAAYIAKHDTAALQKVLDEGLDLDQTNYIDIPERHRSLETIFEQSWQAMTDHEKEQLAGLAVFRGGFTIEAAINVVNIEKKEIGQLVSHSLLLEDGQGRYGIHGLTQQFVLERLPQNKVTQERHAIYYANLPEYSFNTSKVGYLTELKRESANLQAAWEWALEHHRNDLLGLLVSNILTITLLRGPLSFGENLLLRAKHELALDDDLELKRIINFALAKIYLVQMRFNEMVTLMKELPVSAMTLFTEGQALSAQGEAHKARPILETALEMNGDLGNQIVEMDCLRELGNIANRLNEYETAVMYYERCMKIAQQLGDKRNESAVLNNWASVDWDMGDLDAAEERYREALALYRELGNRTGESKALNNLSNVSAERGDLEKSLSYGLDALAIHKEMGNIRGQSAVFNNLGATYYIMKQYDAARGYYLKALEGYRMMENNQAIAETLANLSLLDCVQGKLEEGRKTAEEAIGLAEAAGDKINLSNAHYYLGRIEMADGYLENAESSFMKAYKLRQAVPHPGRFLEIEVELMNIAYQRREYDRARQMMGEVLTKVGSVDSTSDPERVVSLIERIKSKLQ